MHDSSTVANEGGPGAKSSLYASSSGVGAAGVVAADPGAKSSE